MPCDITQKIVRHSSLSYGALCDFPHNPLKLLPSRCSYNAWRIEIAKQAMLLKAKTDIIDFYKQRTVLTQKIHFFLKKFIYCVADLKNCSTFAPQFCANLKKLLQCT